jgi:hypothetical protein
MTPFDLRNAIPYAEIEAGVRRGRQLRAEAVRDVIGRIFRHSPLGERQARHSHNGVLSPC